MSELKRLAREYLRKVEEAEGKTAKTLGEVSVAIKITDKERRAKIADALNQVREGANLIASAVETVLKALDEGETDTGQIIAQVEGMKAKRLADVQQIEHKEEKTDGDA